MNVHTRYKLRKGLHKVAPVYKVLSHTILKPEDKRIVAKQVIQLVTPQEAKKLVGFKSPWGYTSMNPTPGTRPKEAGVLSYKGVEVALFYKRTTEDIVPDPEDPLPEGILEHPEDVWVRFDLMGLPARKLNELVRKEYVGMTHEMRVMQAEVFALEATIGAQQHTINTLTGKLAATEKKKKVKK